jgi:hypothetical protein
MEELTKYVTDNYEGLVEIYQTHVDQDKITFDDFCMTMFIQYIKLMNETKID